MVNDKSFIRGTREAGYEIELFFKSYAACVQFNYYFMWKFILKYKVLFFLVMIVFGLFSCILGNILFKFEVFILCILMVTILIFIFSQYIFPSGIANWIIWIMLVIGLLLGSTAGFFAFKYYIKIGTLLAGGICGFFLGQFLYNLFGNRIVVNGIIINIIFVVVAIGAMIFICFCYKKMSIIISTSFIGSHIFIRGISLLAGDFQV